MRTVMELVAEGEGSPRGSRTIGRSSWSGRSGSDRFLTDGFALDALAEDDFRRTHPFADLAAVV
ncbi:MAG TPA: hypothetical protein VFU33_07290 [Gaiellaceae bacterium]|nr:hypothetical protein [Gaiellaceae bacterium]